MMIMNRFLTSSSTVQTKESVASTVGFVTVEWQLIVVHRLVAIIQSLIIDIVVRVIMKYFYTKVKISF